MHKKLSACYAQILGITCALVVVTFFVPSVFAQGEPSAVPAPPLVAVAPQDPPRALRLMPHVPKPKLKSDAKFDFSSISATSVYVVDVASRAVLMEYNADVPHPLASITKLMTACVTLDYSVPLSKKISVIAKDEVGGARLRVNVGTKLSVKDLLNVALIGSANNTANALARATNLSRNDFVAEMNAKAKKFGLGKTTFTEPTGIDTANVSTAKEIAALGLEAFAFPDIRRATTTARYFVSLASGARTVKNTNGLLTDERNGLYVLGGKTGYLVESQWNLVVKMRDARSRPIEVVVLGAETQKQSFRDAETIARWVWSHYAWSSRPLSFRP